MQHKQNTAEKRKLVDLTASDTNIQNDNLEPGEIVSADKKLRTDFRSVDKSNDLSTPARAETSSASTTSQIFHRNPEEMEALRNRHYILHLCATGNFNFLRNSFRNRSISLTEESKGGKNALYWAVYGGNIEVINGLLTANSVSIDSTTDTGINALQLACAMGYLEIAKILYSKQKNLLSHKDNDGKDISTYAAMSDNAEIIAWVNKVKEEQARTQISSATTTSTSAAFTAPLPLAPKRKWEDFKKSIPQDKMEYFQERKYNDFLMACGMDRWDLAFQLYQKDNSLLESKDKNGRNAFLVSCIFNSEKVVTELLKLKPHFLESTCPQKVNGFHYAYMNRATHLSQHLLQLKPEFLTSLDGHGRSAYDLTTSNSGKTNLLNLDKTGFFLARLRPASIQSSAPNQPPPPPLISPISRPATPFRNSTSLQNPDLAKPLTLLDKINILSNGIILGVKALGIPEEHEDLSRLTRTVGPLLKIQAVETLLTSVHNLFFEKPLVFEAGKPVDVRIATCKGVLKNLISEAGYDEASNKELTEFLKGM
jgi:ankyrin repeat protein